MSKSRIVVAALALAMVLAFNGLVVAQSPTPINLTAWSSSDQENKDLQAHIDDFNTANPDIKVTLNYLPGDYTTGMQAAFASGDYPDVFYVDSSKFYDWVTAGVIADGATQIENPSGIYPSLAAGFTYNGDLYCPPKDFSTLALEYNKDMFDQAGIAYPTASWTWTDLQNAAQKLTGQTSDGKPILGLILPPDFNRWLPFLFQAGGSIFDANGNPTLDSDAAKQAIEYYDGLVSSGSAGTPDQVDSGWGGEAIGKGRAAMDMDGNWIIEFLKSTYPNLNWGVAEMPQGSAGQATMAYTVCYAVGANTKNPDAAWKLVNFLTGDQGELWVGQKGFGVMPTRPSASDAWTQRYGQAMQAFVTGATYAHVWQLPVGYGDLASTFTSAQQQAFAGQILPDDVLTQAQQVAMQIQQNGGGTVTPAPTATPAETATPSS